MGAVKMFVLFLLRARLKFKAELAPKEAFFIQGVFSTFFSCYSEPKTELNFLLGILLLCSEPYTEKEAAAAAATAGAECTKVILVLVL